MPDRPSQAGSRAVSLSYAHEDTVAVQRIAEALRAAGVEVWFDQSELRGGDAWDAKIKSQIRDCALFLPAAVSSSVKRNTSLTVRAPHAKASTALASIAWSGN